VRITWENHGVAPAYHQYDLYVKFIPKDGGAELQQQLTGVNNKAWMPGEIIAEQYSLIVSKSWKTGTYDMLIGMKDNCSFHKGRAVGLGMMKSRELQPGFYKVGEITVE
jgi:uncharacterized protein DUF4832